MLPLSQASAGVVPAAARRISPSTLPSLKFSNPNPFRRSKFIIPSTNPAKPLNITLSKAEGTVDSTKQALSNSPTPPPFPTDHTVFVGDQNVPLEGVIQFDKPDGSSRFTKWGRVALLAGGDVLALLLFSSIGRFSHGLPVFDFDTLRTADPFIAGWFLSAYFLGGYGEDGRGLNGYSKAVIAASKSWALGIPLGLIIRVATSGHIPPYNFIGVTMGSTAVLLIGWRAIRYKVFPVDNSKKNNVYRRGNPFELFELLTSLVRRW